MRCKVCKDKFDPKYFLQKVCLEPTCILEWSKKVKEKEWKAEKKILKDNLKTNADHVRELQPIFNQIAREIDKDSLCLMCGTTPKKKNGCHYHSVGANPSLRFNLFNIWLGCEKCNSWLGGNINGYDLELIKYYNRDKWEYIKFDIVRLYPSLHLSIPRLVELKVIAKDILKEVKKMPVLTHEERWNIRKELNKRIGIYK